jgi:hypothetical protein
MRSSAEADAERVWVIDTSVHPRSMQASERGLGRNPAEAAWQLAPAPWGSGFLLLARDEAGLRAWAPPGVPADGRRHEAVERWRFATGLHATVGGIEAFARTTIVTLLDVLSDVPRKLHAWVLECTYTHLARLELYVLGGSPEHDDQLAASTAAATMRGELDAVAADRTRRDKVAWRPNRRPSTGDVVNGRSGDLENLVRALLEAVPSSPHGVLDVVVGDLDGRRSDAHRRSWQLFCRMGERRLPVNLCNTRHEASTIRHHDHAPLSAAQRNVGTRELWPSLALLSVYRCSQADAHDLDCAPHRISDEPPHGFAAPALQRSWHSAWDQLAFVGSEYGWPVACKSLPGQAAKDRIQWSQPCHRPEGVRDGCARDGAAFAADWRRDAEQALALLAATIETLKATVRGFAISSAVLPADPSGAGLPSVPSVEPMMLVLNYDRALSAIRLAFDDTASDATPSFLGKAPQSLPGNDLMNAETFGYGGVTFAGEHQHRACAAPTRIKHQDACAPLACSH